jgi:hypothetical protein
MGLSRIMLTTAPARAVSVVSCMDSPGGSARHMQQEVILAMVSATLSRLTIVTGA